MMFTSDSMVHELHPVNSREIEAASSMNLTTSTSDGQQASKMLEYIQLIRKSPNNQDASQCRSVS